jgi:FtsP/CotA-like multicopper oxidase with cupredoxin domain
LLFDMPAGRVLIRDQREPRRRFVLRELLGVAQSGQGRTRSAIAPLPPNRWLEPQLQKARSFDVVFEGGARGQLRSARVGNQTVSTEQLLERYQMNWAINGVANRDHDPSPFIKVRCNDTVLLRLRNDSAWHHPIHLHGFHFEVLSVDGKPPAVRTVRDTFMMEPRSRAEIAFVADNPGTWMFHCHILQHQAGGMMAAIQVE